MIVPSFSPHGFVPAMPLRQVVCLWHYQGAKSLSLGPLGDSNVIVLAKHLEITFLDLLPVVAVQSLSRV